ncbi:F-box domain-containing protein [Heracleum sosnowskyi]|uniref:F-box domain-containing protein n=1 Tax=Heracleum sosnowskyi TaxID=360622 RepID=A0AAD8MLG9_9APIA|nr:F-box domain-containing protein [Heracleum sosnowskyi]
MISHLVGGILPEELMMEIIMKIPVRFLARLRCVCKSWNVLFTDPQFAAKLLEHSRSNNTHQKLVLFSGFSRPLAGKYVALFRQLHEQPRILFEINPKAGRKLDYFPNLNFTDCLKECVVCGSINGIICLSSIYTSHTRFVILWNPSINYWKPIYLPPLKHYYDGAYSSFGLAFDSLTNDYKIIMLVSSVSTRPCPTSRIEVYSAKQDSWSEVNSQVPFFTTRPNCSLILKGVPYWSRNYIPTDCSHDDCQRNFIASVHPHTGLYKKIPYPQIVLNKKTSIHPFNFMDSLALLIYSPGDKPNQTFHVYALDDEDGSATTWINIYSTDTPTILQNQDICILQCFEDAGKTVVVGWNHDENVSFLYDLKTDCLIDSIGLDAFRVIWDESFYHVESLVCIPGMQPIPNEDDYQNKRTAPKFVGRQQFGGVLL